MSAPVAPLHVVAAVLRDQSGRVLLCQRPAGKAHAGLWEFPGGKVEPGEAPLDALTRELDEELGITVRAASPLHRVPWRAEERTLLLDAWRVERFDGEPRGRDGQALQWLASRDVFAWPMPPADLPIARVIDLPSRYAISAEPGDARTWLRQLGETLEKGARLVQFRAKTLAADMRVELAREALALCRAWDARLLINDDVALARELGADGVHLTSASLMRWHVRPVAEPFLVFASCHDEAQLLHAERLGLDAVTLSPVHATASHEDALPLGWARFATLARDRGVACYALGGVRQSDLDIARAHGAFGVAGIGDFWRG